jgi:hypothetical protein
MSGILHPTEANSGACSRDRAPVARSWEHAGARWIVAYILRSTATPILKAPRQSAEFERTQIATERQRGVSIRPTTLLLTNVNGAQTNLLRI